MMACAPPPERAALASPWLAPGPLGLVSLAAAVSEVALHRHSGLRRLSLEVEGVVGSAAAPELVLCDPELGGFCFSALGALWIPCHAAACASSVDCSLKRPTMRCAAEPLGWQANSVAV